MSVEDVELPIMVIGVDEWCRSNSRGIGTLYLVEHREFGAPPMVGAFVGDDISKKEKS
jgi:hypothetical protein